MAWLGPLVADSMDLEGAWFAGHAEIVAETGLVRVRFDDSAIPRLRYAVLGLGGPLLPAPAVLAVRARVKR